MANDNVQLAPLLESPVLQRVGIKKHGRFGLDSVAPTMEAWRKARTSAYGRTELKASDEDKGVEEQVINGVVVKHYN